MDGPLARAVVEPQSTKDLEAVLGSLPSARSDGGTCRLRPSQPSRCVPAARATRFGRAGLGPWATTIGRVPWAVGRPALHTHRNPRADYPSGRPSSKMCRQPRSLRSGVGGLRRPRHARRARFSSRLPVVAPAGPPLLLPGSFVQLRASCAWLRAPPLR